MQSIITNIITKIVIGIATAIATAVHAKYGYSLDLVPIATDIAALIASFVAWKMSHTSILADVTGYEPGNAPNITKGAEQLTKTGLIAALCLLPFASSAQTNAVPNFINQTYAWATAVNTNYDWANVSYQLASGYKNTVSGAPAAFVSGDRNWKNLELGAEFQILASSVTIQQAQLRLGYAFYQNHDFRLDAAIYGGYDCVNYHGLVEPEFRATKLLTVNTYTFISYSLPFETGGKFNTVGQVRSGLGIAF